MSNNDSTATIQNPPINATFALSTNHIFTDKIKANLKLFVYDDFVTCANAVDVF